MSSDTGRPDTVQFLGAGVGIAASVPVDEQFPVAIETGDPDADATDDVVASAVTVVVLELSPLPHDANAAAARVRTVIVCYSAK